MQTLQSILKCTSHRGRGRKVSPPIKYQYQIIYIQPRDKKTKPSHTAAFDKQRCSCGHPEILVGAPDGRFARPNGERKRTTLAGIFVLVIRAVEAPSVVFSYAVDITVCAIW